MGRIASISLADQSTDTVSSLAAFKLTVNVIELAISPSTTVGLSIDMIALTDLIYACIEKYN